MARFLILYFFFINSSIHLIKSFNHMQNHQPHPQNNQQRQERPWLKQTLQNIENYVSLDASVLMQNPPLQPTLTLKKTKLSNDTNQEETKQKSLAELKKEESMIREKLREICKLQKLVKPGSVYNQQATKVKTNQQLKQLTRKYRQFKKKLIQKTQIIQQEEQEYKEKARKLKQEQLKTECQERRKKIEETLQKMEERRVRRQKQLKQQKIKLKELKKQKLYEKMRENFNKSMNQMSQQKIQRYRRMKNSCSVDMSQLSAHQRRYEEEKSQKQQKRTQRMAQSRILPAINCYKSRFFDQIMEHDRQQQEKQLEAAERAKMVKKMHKQYQERIQEFAPSIKENLSNSSMNKQNKKCALDRSQVFKKGNQLYKQSLKNVLPLEKRPLHQKQKQLELEALLPKAYPNYLPQISKKLSPSASKTSNSSYTEQCQKLRSKILENDKIKKEDKIVEVRNLVEKLEHGYSLDKASQDQIFRRLNAKMSLLELLQ